MEESVKKHKRRSRIVAILGILPGVWFLLSTQTQLGQRLQIGCGYWVIMLVVLTAIWIFYIIFAKLIMRDISVAHEHAHSLSEKRYYNMAYMTTAAEAFFASVIIILSLVGFLATDIRCFVGQWSEEGRLPTAATTSTKSPAR